MTGSALHTTGSTRQWRNLRQAWAERLADQGSLPCLVCDQPIYPWDEWHLAHDDPKIAGGSDADARPAHSGCNLTEGGHIGQARLATAIETGRAHARQKRGEFLDNVPGQDTSVAGISPPVDMLPRSCPDAGDAVWDVPWLGDGLRDVPQDATWPRFMSLPHPRAVGSLGSEFEGWLAAEGHGVMRWWQRLVAFRLLEVDGEGELCWLFLLLTLARQVGKSTLIRFIALWRLHQGAAFGEAQLIAHVASTIRVGREAQRPARLWAKRLRELYKVREVNSQEEIELLADGSRWLLLSKDNPYGFSAGLGIVDEGWDVKAHLVEDGIEPTLVERAKPQLLLISTAHRKATTLMLSRRRTAIAEMAEPADILIVEWSAEPGGDISDREQWRAASPHWSAQRERLISSKLKAAREGTSDDPTEPDPIEAFKSQWLNIWPSRRRQVKEPFVPETAWPACQRLPAPGAGHDVVLAVEGLYGPSVSVVGCAVGGGVFHVWTSESASDDDLATVLRAAAVQWEVLETVRSPKFRATLFDVLEQEMALYSWTGATTDEAASSGDFYRAILGRTVMHDHHPVVTAHMRAADGHIAPDGTLRLRRVEGGDPADAAVAAKNAWFRAMSLMDTAPDAAPVIY